MEKITIGLLLPSSTIFPVSKDFEKGIKEGLNYNPDFKLEVEIIKEFVGQGDVREIEKACNKFFNYDDVDIVTGVISSKATHEIADSFKNQQKPLVVNNTGGHIPDISKLNEYIFINSSHLWQHAWTMGHWGVKKLGKKGMFIGAVYDAGYSFSHMFYLGMETADQQREWSFSVPPMPAPGTLSNMDVIFPYLEKYEPDFVFATFCGAETTLFINEFIKRGWHHRTKLTGLPYLLAPFEPLGDDITIYTTVPFNNAPEITAEKSFYHLGIQTGQNIAEAASKADSGGAELKDQLAKLNCMFNISDQINDGPQSQLTIVQNEIKANEKTFVSKELMNWDTFGMNINAMRPLTAEISTGWYNPYLCI